MLSVCFTGKRPKDLCGYDKEKYKLFVDWMTDKIIVPLYDCGYRKFYTGGAQGFDQLAFWAVNRAKTVIAKRNPDLNDIENIVVIPHKEQDSLWAETGVFSKSEYQALLKYADLTITLDKKGDNKNEVVKSLLFARNHFMVDNADLIVALYPTDDFKAYSGTAECIRYALYKNKPIMQIKYSNTNYLKATEVIKHSEVPKEKDFQSFTEWMKEEYDL